MKWYFPLVIVVLLSVPFVSSAQTVTVPQSMLVSFVAQLNQLIARVAEMEKNQKSCGAVAPVTTPVSASVTLDTQIANLTSVIATKTKEYNTLEQKYINSGCNDNGGSCPDLRLQMRTLSDFVNASKAQLQTFQVQRATLAP